MTTTPVTIFTPETRERLRAALVAEAARDPRITAAAHTGSFATDTADRWSDIDLALRLAADADEAQVVAAWTGRLYEAHGAVAHHDMWRGRTRFRVFLLADTLQVDLAFWSAEAFGAMGPSFRLIFGDAPPRPLLPAADTRDLLGMAWLYALHVRSSLARGRRWQAKYMLHRMLEHTLALACVRYGLTPAHARAWDDLPPEVTRPLEASLTGSLDEAALRRTFVATTEALQREAAYADRELADRLAAPLAMLTSVHMMESI